MTKGWLKLPKCIQVVKLKLPLDTKEIPRILIIKDFWKKYLLEFGSDLSKIVNVQITC